MLITRQKVVNRGASESRIEFDRTGVVVVRVIVIVIDLATNSKALDFSSAMTSTAALSTSTIPEPCRFQRP